MCEWVYLKKLYTMDTSIHEYTYLMYPWCSASSNTPTCTFTQSHTRTQTHTRTHTHTHIQTHTYTHTNTPAHPYTRTPTPTHTQYTHIHTHTQEHTEKKQAHVRNFSVITSSAPNSSIELAGVLSMVTPIEPPPV